MTRFFGVFTLLLLAVLAVAQRSDSPVWRAAAMPFYPPLARQARIQGQVKIEFAIAENGDVVSVNLVSGHPMLAPAALNTVQSWRFNADQQRSGRKYETIFDFTIDTNADPKDADKVSVTTDTFRHVEVRARFSEFQVSDCPSEQESKPPASIKDSDFVEMSASGCFGTCAVYTVRVSAVGTVTWNGEAYVASKGKRKATVTPTEARNLLEEFRSDRFWALCGSSTRSITDSATTDIKVRIGGRLKSVSNYADSAPPWVGDLEFAIGSVANTHLWRHGDPAVEPITRLGRDAYTPKPGVTAMMRCCPERHEKNAGTLEEQP